VQVYDPETDSWELIENMWPWCTTASISPLTVYQDSIVAADTGTQRILQYDAATNTWSPLAQIRGFSQPIEGRRNFCSLESDGEQLYILGGYLDAAYAAYGVNDVEGWDPAGGWEAKEVDRKAPIGSTMASVVLTL
jgi:hypothetical protein